MPGRSRQAHRPRPRSPPSARCRQSRACRFGCPTGPSPRPRAQHDRLPCSGQRPRPRRLPAAIPRSRARHPAGCAVCRRRLPRPRRVQPGADAEPGGGTHDAGVDGAHISAAARRPGSDPAWTRRADPGCPRVGAARLPGLRAARESVGERRADEGRHVARPTGGQPCSIGGRPSVVAGSQRPVDSCLPARRTVCGAPASARGPIDPRWRCRRRTGPVTRRAARPAVRSLPRDPTHCRRQPDPAVGHATADRGGRR